jgi:hypothetical protein
MIARKIAGARLLFAADSASAAAAPNFSGVVCGKRPLTSRVWLSKLGAVCGADGRVNARDERFLGRLPKTNAVLTLERGRGVLLP